MALLNTASSGSSKESKLQRKKRTRPVSACENCHSKKVKCILKADEPVCQRCSLLGAECLFRVDDLSAELRLKRFSDYGPAPNINDEEEILQSRRSDVPQRGTSLSTSEGSYGCESDLRKKKQSKLLFDGKTTGKAKAKFRSFANPAKLGPPTRRITESDASSEALGGLQQLSYAATRSSPVRLSNEKELSQVSFPPMLLDYTDPFSSINSNYNISGTQKSTQRENYHQRHNSHMNLSTDDSHSNDLVSNDSIDRLSVSHLLSASPMDVATTPFVQQPPSISTGSNVLPHQPFSSQTMTSQQMYAPRLAKIGSTSQISQPGESNGQRFDQSQRGAKQGRSGESLTRSANGTDQPPPKFERMALPFFRWFGATANTPGIRRIQVGVYHESGQNSVDVTERERATASKTNEATSLHIDQTYLSPSSASLSLFDTERPRYPRRDILIQLVNLIIKYFKASCFPWLDDEELLAGAEAGELPAVLANALCAVGAQISNHKDLGHGNAKTKGEPFSDMAKVLIVPMLSWPSLDVIEALLIISYSEFALGSDSGLWMYIGMALRMATDLGLQYEATITSMANQKLQDRARLLFWAIVSLDRITCFGTGRSVSIREDSFDCKLPTLAEDTLSDGLVFGHIVRVLLKRGHIGELLNQNSNDLSLEEKGKKLQSIWHDLAHYYETLPPTLQFGVTTFRILANANQGAAFVYLHVLLQSIMSLLNRPSLLRRFDKDFNMSIPSKLASIANQASGTIVSILRFAEDASSDLRATQKSFGENPSMNPYIDCNPYLDQLILPAGRAFLAEKEGVGDALRRLGYTAQSRCASRRGSKEGLTVEDEVSNTAGKQFTTVGPFDGFIAKGQYAQMNLMTCQHMLDRLAIWWSGADWPARALRQETIGAADDDVDSGNNDEGTQPAPVRDVEMILKWAKSARGKKMKRTSNKKSLTYPSHQDINLSNEVTESSSTLASQNFSNESNASGDSPLGLGFSGQFSTTTEVDTQAIINAWANQGLFNDFMQQSSRWQDRDQARSDQVTEQFGAFAPLQFNNPSDTPQQVSSQNQVVSPPGVMDFDFTTMQLEEFFGAGLEPIRPTQGNDLIGQESFVGGVGTGYGWENLPSALLNAFTFHHSHDYTHSRDV